MLVVATACNDGTGPDDGDLDEPFVLGGVLQNPDDHSIPENARVLVGWSAADGTGDHLYLFGEGTLDPEAETFEVSFDSTPPPTATYGGIFGVGIILVTSNQSLSEGVNIALNDVIGAAGSYGVIYVADESVAGELVPWTSEFDPGFGVGIGGPEGDNGYEPFVPTDADSVILTIDDVEDIEFVTWT